MKVTHSTMYYSKANKELSQEQAIENLKAVLGSAYFGNYDLYVGGSNIQSDVMNVDIFGFRRDSFEPFKVKEVVDVANNLLDQANTKGSIERAIFQVSPSEEKRKSMHFADIIYDEDGFMPLSFVVERTDINSKTYKFGVFQQDYKDSFLRELEQEGCLKDTKQKIAIWRREITRNLNNILLHPIHDQYQY